jgi:hypothetical protein
VAAFLEEADLQGKCQLFIRFFSFAPDNGPPPEVSGTARYDPLPDMTITKPAK